MLSVQACKYLYNDSKRSRSYWEVIFERHSTGINVLVKRHTLKRNSEHVRDVVMRHYTYNGLHYGVHYCFPNPSEGMNYVHQFIADEKAEKANKPH